MSTATEKRNIRRLAEFLGYKTPNKTPSVVRLKVTTTIDADTDGNPKYGDLSSGHPIDSGLQIASNVDSEVIFETTGEIDFTCCAGITPERQKYLNFTKPYISSPMVIVTRKDGDFVGSLRDLQGKIISLPENYYTSEVISKDHPNIKINYKTNTPRYSHGT